jgi:spermidine/putrescine transport system permease protein
MATSTLRRDATTPAAVPAGSGPSAGYRVSRWLSDHLILLVGGAVLLFLFLPIIYVVLLSFNKPESRGTNELSQFTTGNWTNICAPDGMCDSLVLSLQIGLLATLGATLLGTLMAFALVRHRFRGQASTNLLIFLPMATPEVVMGSSLLALFVAAGFAGVLGFWTILIAHIMFCVSFVVVTVKARLAGMDYRLEQAAMDLYANEWETFRRVTLPLVMPGIAAAALLAFSLSFDDFIITNFNSGTTVTFPLFVWGAAQRGIPPQVNVIGTLMFLIAFSVVAGAEVVRRRRSAAA